MIKIENVSFTYENADNDAAILTSLDKGTQPFVVCDG